MLSGVLASAVDIIKKVAVMIFVVSILSSIGYLINTFIPWEYLGQFFKIVRSFVAPMDFFWNTELTLTLIGVSFFVEGVIWGLKALILLINFIGWNK